MINYLFSKLKLITNNVAFVMIFLLVSSSSYAQKNQTVSGLIKDENGEPIIGVTVQKAGTQVITASDFDGQYSIKAKKGDIIQFSYLGKEKISKTVTGSTLNVVMITEANALDEVVLIGYGSVKKKELTGAVARVEAEEIERITTSDLGSAIQGQISGVNVVASSTPGGDSEILIRGITSINGDNTPLFVLDGIIQENDPKIAPSEIASLDVLKDAASTAIYGARGAAGVILITTKQGEKGSLKVRLNGSSGIQVRRPAVSLLNSADQLYVNTVSFRNTTGNIDSDIRLNAIQNPAGLQNETNLNDIIFNDEAYLHNYNVNVSGGSKDMSYNVTMGLFEQTGLQLNSGYNRFNTRSNTTYKKDKLTINTSVGLSIDNRDIPRTNLLSQLIVYSPNQAGLNIEQFSDLTDNGEDANRLTWVIESLRTEEYLKTLRSNASININYNLSKNISLIAKGGLNYSTGRRKTFRPYQPVFNRSTQEEISNPINSFIEDRSTENKSFYTELGTNIKKTFDKHKVNLSLFVTAEEYTREDFRARRVQPNNDLNVLNAAIGEQTVRSGFDYTNTRLSQISRLQYSYNEKYNLSTSIRFDKSSIFHPDRNLGIFPSVAFAWNVSDEDFWLGLKDKINSFKIRASHGTVGNDRIGPYNYQATVIPNLNYYSADGTNENIANGATQQSIVDPSITWETSRQKNLGVDLAFLRNKFTLSAEYYITDKENMLFPIRTAPTDGGGVRGTVTRNVGNMTNEGIEIAAKFKHQIGKLWFQMSGTFATNKNVITRINGTQDFLLTNDFGLVSRAPNQSRITGHKVGREAGAFYLWQTDGIIDSQEKLADYQTINSNARMGDVIFKDLNNDGSLDDDDRVYSGSGLPKYEIGYNLVAYYKNFDFSMNWYAALGHEVINGFNAWAYGFGRHQDLVYQWSEANPVTTVPAYRDDIRRHDNFIGYSDLWQEDGSYLRLRQITLGYSLSKKAVKKLGINKLRFYVSSQNPLTFTKYSGYNPEVGGGINARGLDKGTGPISVQYLAGVNFNF